jgi:hypothetical protein
MTDHIIFFWIGMNDDDLRRASTSGTVATSSNHMRTESMSSMAAWTQTTLRTPVRTRSTMLQPSQQIRHGTRRPPTESPPWNRTSSTWVTTVEHHNADPSHHRPPIPCRGPAHPRPESSSWNRPPPTWSPRGTKASCHPMVKPCRRWSSSDDSELVTLRICGNRRGAWGRSPGLVDPSPCLDGCTG